MFVMTAETDGSTHATKQNAKEYQQAAATNQDSYPEHATQTHAETDAK